MRCLRLTRSVSVQLATIFEAKYGEVSKQVAQFKADVRGERNEPVVPIDFSDRFVRQSMMLNFDQFIEPIERLPLPSHLDVEGLTPNEFQADYISEAAMTQAILDVVIDDAAALLDALPDRTADSPLESSGIANIVGLAHGEQIDVWTEELKTTINRLQRRKRKSISLLDLICALESRHQASRQDCLVKTWLAFLLGSHPYELHRTAHDFYSVVGIEVVWEDDQGSAP